MTPPTPQEAEIAGVAEAIMRARVKWGWTFGKRPKVMAIDLIMAEAAVRAYKAHLQRAQGER